MLSLIRFPFKKIRSIPSNTKNNIHNVQITITSRIEHEFSSTIIEQSIINLSNQIPQKIGSLKLQILCGSKIQIQLLIMINKLNPFPINLIHAFGKRNLLILITYQSIIVVTNSSQSNLFFIRNLENLSK